MGLICAHPRKSQRKFSGSIYISFFFSCVARPVMLLDFELLYSPSVCRTLNHRTPPSYFRTLKYRTSSCVDCLCHSHNIISRHVPFAITGVFDKCTCHSRIGTSHQVASSSLQWNFKSIDFVQLWGKSHKKQQLDHFSSGENLGSGEYIIQGWWCVFLLISKENSPICFIRKLVNLQV